MTPVTGRWNVLVLLFSVRLSMAFQFQLVASMSPALMADYGVGLGDIGFLISLYLAPGLVFALPGGEVGRRFGDKEVVLFGLALMVAGGITMGLASTWGWQIAGRIIAGTGGVLLNVLMSKMVTDWFAGKEIATAMAIFVNSWPAGIALCLFVAPIILAQHGITFVFYVSTIFCTIGFVAMATLYPAPHQAQQPDNGVPRNAWPTSAALQAIVAAGCIWGLFNAALAMVFGFGPTMLVQNHWSLTAAGSATSMVLWLVTLSVPLGGYLADRTGRRAEIMLLGFVVTAVFLAWASRTSAVIPMFAALGLVGGLSAGAIMSLPARVLSPNGRAVGMGIFFTLFYAIAILAPIVAGIFSVNTGSAKAAFDFGAAMLIACLPLYWVFTRLAARVENK